MFSRLGAFWSGERSDYVPLPSFSPNAVRSEMSSRARRVFRQRNFKLFAVLLVFALFGFLWTSEDIGENMPQLQVEPIDPLHPPLYEEYEAHELGLPQHSTSLPPPDGSGRRFLFPANHMWGIGFNNVLQEHLLLAQVAYLANWTFVFDPYTWHWDPNEPYGDYGGKPVPSRIPWHAFLQGPLVGDTFPDGYTHPRAIRKEFFKEICPQPEIINSSVVGIHFQENYPAAMEITNAWVDYLQTLDNPCIEINGWSPHIFDVGAFMTPRISTIFDSLMHSPLLRNLEWSSLVESVISMNIHLLRPKLTRLQRIWASFARFLGPQADDTPSTTSFPGLLAMHVRRGDYEVHCYALEELMAPMQGWYTLPGIPDRFVPPPGNKTEEQHKYFRDHCWPTIDQMVDKIRDVRATKEGAGLNSVYIMTNGNPTYVAALEKAISELGGFKVISSSRDMVWTPEGKYISQAIDMAIANRAQIFIGNGFSSLSSNVVLMRFKDDMPPASNRMW